VRQVATQHRDDSPRQRHQFALPADPYRESRSCLERRPPGFE
jgi:hypothetical protein